jgi:hypothetical protein
MREAPAYVPWFAAMAGLIALAAGAGVYLLARAPGSSYLPGGLGLGAGSLAGSAPSLLHAAAFTLLSAASLGFTRRQLVASAAGWTFVGLAFEALQHPTVAQALWPRPGALAGAGFGDRVVALVAGYAHGGTFDPLDLLATLLGGVLAAFLGLHLIRRGAP